MQQTDGERLTRVETRLETIESAILRMEAKFDAWQVNFVSKEMLEDKLRLRDDRIKQLEDARLEQKRTLPTWVSVLIGVGMFVLAVVTLIKGWK